MSPKPLDLRPPIASQIYVAVRDAAEAAGVGEPFRFTSMLLRAPWHLKPLKLVFTNLAKGLAAIADWNVPTAFAAMNEVSDWFLTNVHNLEVAWLC